MLVIIANTKKRKAKLLRRAAAAATDKSLQSCPNSCDPIDGTLPGSSVFGILQARILEWVAICFSDACMHAKSLQSCPTLCDPIDSSPPVFSVHGISPGKNTAVGYYFLFQLRMAGIGLMHIVKFLFLKSLMTMKHI